MEEAEKKNEQIEVYSCSNCGAYLKYKPGTTSLICEYCNTQTIITDQQKAEVEELDYIQYSQMYEGAFTQETKVLTCKQCGSESSYDENIKSDHCPYCNSPFVEADLHSERLFKPSYVLPFKVTDDAVHGYLRRWFRDLWFAPNALKKIEQHSGNLRGVYIPCWTYDAQTHTEYSGRRGDNYSETVGSGNNRKTVTKTRWSDRYGTVNIFFDDVLVPASKFVDKETFGKIGGWDSQNLMKADDRFLSGFMTEKYALKLNDGFPIAKNIMEQRINTRVKQEIGGDQQVITSLHTEFSGLTFKLILLPVYMSSYIYKNKLYHFFVNGRNGIITGKRPYSVAKITISIVLAIIIFITLLILVNK